MTLIDRASWLTSFFISATVYYTLSKLFPPTSTYVDYTVESIDEHLSETDHQLSPYPGIGGGAGAGGRGGGMGGVAPWESSSKEDNKYSPAQSPTATLPKYGA